MNNTNLVIGIVVVVAVFGAGYFMFSGSLGGLGVGARLMEQNERTLKGLIASGKNQECTFTNATEAGESSGTVYFSKGMMRGDFKSADVTSGVSVISHMLTKDNVSYMWTDGTEMGFKMDMSSMMEGAGSGSANLAQSIDVNQEYGYDCKSWSPDAAMFELPKEITFASMSDMMQGIEVPTSVPGAGGAGATVPVGDMKAIQCAACNAIPEGADRDQCLETLGCAAI